MKHDYHGVNWDNKLVLGIPVIDNQHRNLWRMSNKFFAFGNDNGETSSWIFNETAHKAAEYLRSHFITEEKIMILINYERFFDHKKHHEDLLRNIDMETSMIPGKQNMVPDRFAYFFKDWMLSDISMHDRKMTECIHNMKEFGKFGMIFSSYLPQEEIYETVAI